MDLLYCAHWHNHFPYVPPRDRPESEERSESDPASDPLHRCKISYFAPGAKIKCDSNVLAAGKDGQYMYGKGYHRAHDHTAIMQRENTVRRTPIDLNCVVTASSRLPVVRDASLSIALSAKVAVACLPSSSTFGAQSDSGIGVLLLVT